MVSDPFYGPLPPLQKPAFCVTEEEVYKAAPTHGPGALHTLGSRVLVLWRLPGPRGKHTYLLGRCRCRWNREGGRLWSSGLLVAQGAPVCSGLLLLLLNGSGLGGTVARGSIKMGSLPWEQFAECSPVTKRS